MTSLPTEAIDLLHALSIDAQAATPLGGGMINRAARVDTGCGPVFVKWNQAAPAGCFAAEADGLQRLASADALRIPRVLGFSDSESENKTAVLVLEYIEAQTQRSAASLAQRFGEGLARLHRTAPTSFQGFGLDRDNYIGSLPQANSPTPTWSEFYREHRLLPQIDLARRHGRLSGARERALLTVIERSDTILDGLPSTPSLIHGDLWSGNFMAAGNTPVLVDPAVYYAEREVEIAYMELFGGFPEGILAAYRSAYPLDEGYERRRPFHQLYPLLVHLNHFGETYAPHVDAACRTCLG